jgi:gliding motility-associated-like protein
VVLDPQSNGLGVNAFQWAPTSSLSCEDCRNPTASPQQSTLYQLTATDVNGCTAVDSVWVILEGSEILLPSAFSPNNDGSNDLFRALNNNIETYQLEVYNRWGELVFAASNPKDAWDGSYKGEPQELGVYIWQARFRLRGSRQTQLASGNVTLIR